VQKPKVRKKKKRALVGYSAEKNLGERGEGSSKGAGASILKGKKSSINNARTGKLKERGGGGQKTDVAVGGVDSEK